MPDFSLLVSNVVCHRLVMERGEHETMNRRMPISYYEDLLHFVDRAPVLTMLSLQGMEPYGWRGRGVVRDELTLPSTNNLTFKSSFSGPKPFRTKRAGIRSTLS